MDRVNTNANSFKVMGLAPNTITRTITSRVMDGIVVSSTSKLG